MIFRTILALALSIAPNLGLPEIVAAVPLMTLNSLTIDPFGGKPSDSQLLPASISVLDNLAPLSPLSSPRFNRFEPGNLPDRLLTQARRFLDTPYRRGGSLRTGRSTDCSGFVQFIYGKANIDLPRASSEQAQVGKLAAHSMDFSRLAAGDLLFFRNGGRRIGHVGIYLGEGKMIHASSHGRGVKVADLRQAHYQGTFVVARRVLEEPRAGLPLGSSVNRKQ